MSYYNGKRNKEKTAISRYILKYAKKIKLIQLFNNKCDVCEISDLDRPWIYQFHHLDKNKKDVNVSTLYGNSFLRIKNEAKNCICVCENCHKKIHSDILTLDKTTIKKLEFLSYKNIKSCEICGYNECIKALDFHHIDEKTYEMSDIISQFSFTKIENMIEQIKNELNKCIIVCSNCHRDLHNDKNKFQLYKKEIYEKIETLEDNYSKNINHDYVLLLNKEGNTQKQIADLVGCGISTVCEILKSNNIHTFEKLRKLDVIKILELRNQGKNNVEISKILNCNRFSIPAAIKKYKLKI